MPHWKSFKIPPDLIATPSLPSSPFLRLPTELLLMVLYQADPLDKICLAFSCRHLLQISALASAKVPCRCKPQCFSQEIEKLLKRVKPVDARGKSKRTWGFCIDCMRYRPTRKSYWNGKVTCGNWAAWDRAVRCWNTKFSLQCPQCWGEEWQSVCPRLHA
ncbi:hypothetical protein P154DRAFT_502388 [Amniculicola lignicola CBS 123094]|uniref:F-box domain-containing protein n=1 Tax=Amniculicola lignicola CBS 123094 TaxID=1392246 RepID=A0A6A5VX21_9PLEO|nr:hypothetical protein P154DRAFT_502388 [Amniculicola lignicola CBS 123094]